MTYDFKDEYLEFHGFLLGTPEAEEAWTRKVSMMERPQKAPMCFVQGDIHYDSPIDGRAITTKHARANDLARSNCIPYEPGMKQDAVRKKVAEEAALDRAVDETVEREVAKMPARKLEKLAAEVENFTPVPQRSV